MDIEKAAERKGAEEMRERCADICQAGGLAVHRQLRALPLPGDEQHGDLKVVHFDWANEPPTCFLKGERTRSLRDVTCAECLAVLEQLTGAWCRSVSEKCDG